MRCSLYHACVVRRLLDIHIQSISLRDPQDLRRADSHVSYGIIIKTPPRQQPELSSTADGTNAIVLLKGIEILFLRLVLFSKVRYDFTYLPETK